MPKKIGRKAKKPTEKEMNLLILTAAMENRKKMKKELDFEDQIEKNRAGFYDWMQTVSKLVEFEVMPVNGELPFKTSELPESIEYCSLDYTIPKVADLP